MLKKKKKKKKKKKGERMRRRNIKYPSNITTKYPVKKKTKSSCLFLRDGGKRSNFFTFSTSPSLQAAIMSSFLVGIFWLAMRKNKKKCGFWQKQKKKNPRIRSPIFRVLFFLSLAIIRWDLFAHFPNLNLNTTLNVF